MFEHVLIWILKKNKEYIFKLIMGFLHLCKIWENNFLDEVIILNSV